MSESKEEKSLFMCAVFQEQVIRIQADGCVGPRALAASSSHPFRGSPREKQRPPLTARSDLS